MRLRKLTLCVQGTYTLLTALWPIVHMESFLWVTGYKTDLWLVKTVAVLLLAIAVCLLLAVPEKRFSLPVAVLALLTATGMAFVDFYFAGNNTIAKIYMADGAAEVLFALVWLFLLGRKGKVSG